MANTYDIKWKNDLKMYMNTFKSFILEGNVNDLQPVELNEGFGYVSLDEAIAEMYSKDYCVVFYDHTKQSGKPIEDSNASDDDDDDEEKTQNKPEEIDDSWFNSFSFYKKTIFSQTGERIPSPNIELFKEYYKKAYLDKLEESSTKDMQGGRIIDIRRIFDVMNDFYEKRKDEKYAEAKPFMFILSGVSRFMTSPGCPDDKENAILMILFNATQIENTSCKLMMFVDKINDLPQNMFDNWASNPNVTKFLTWGPHENVEITKLIIKDWLKGYEEDNYYQWAIEVKEIGEPIGSISVVRINETVNEVEIGYCIGEKWWHQGYTSEAFKRVIEFLFDEVGVKRICAKHDTDNPNSGRVMLKCGLEREGTLRKAGRNSTNAVCDLAVYSILNY